MIGYDKKNSWGATGNSWGQSSGSAGGTSGGAGGGGYTNYPKKTAPTSNMKYKSTPITEPAPKPRYYTQSSDGTYTPHNSYQPSGTAGTIQGVDPNSMNKNLRKNMADDPYAKLNNLYAKNPYIGDYMAAVSNTAARPLMETSNQLYAPMMMGAAGLIQDNPYVAGQMAQQQSDLGDRLSRSGLGMSGVGEAMRGQLGAQQSQTLQDMQMQRAAAMSGLAGQAGQMGMAGLGAFLQPYQMERQIGAGSAEARRARSAAEKAAGDAQGGAFGGAIGNLIGTGLQSAMGPLGNFLGNQFSNLLGGGGSGADAQDGTASGYAGADPYGQYFGGGGGY